jgi:hypothetical protein
MRELNEFEAIEASGGVLPAAVVGSTAVGIIVGGYSAWHSGGNAGQIAAGAILGGVSGFYGGLGMFGSAIATGAFSAFAGGGGRWTRSEDVAAH